MKKQVNHTIRKRFNEVIYNISRYAEIFLSVVILVVIAMASVPLISELFQTPVMEMKTSFFTDFLSQALSLVVGVEFVKMLCRHSAETVVDVLLFAIARQMVVEHLATRESLIGVISITILFIVRKYFLPPEKPSSEKTS